MVDREPLSKVVVAMPRYRSEAHHLATVALLTASVGLPETIPISPGGSALTSVFNQAWAAAVDAYERGDCDGFAMIHSDIGVPEGWVNVLHGELLAVDADLVGALIDIKDGRGLTTTAVENQADRWHPRRISKTEAASLPETFTDADVGGELLLNTGCWIIRLGPWCLEQNPDGTLKNYFHMHNRIVRVGGVRRAGLIPEDWDWSRQMRRAGLRLAATRKLLVRHFGDGCWESDKVRGWEYDLQNGPALKRESLIATDPAHSVTEVEVSMPILAG